MLLAMLLALASTPASAPNGWNERWTATSTAASSITGDLAVHPNRIVFGNGRSMAIKRLRTVRFTDTIGGGVAPAILYQVVTPVDPVLLNGNRLCGGATRLPVTFVVLWRSAPAAPGLPDGRGFAPYSSRTRPGPSTKDACGVYYYEVGR